MSEYSVIGKPTSYVDGVAKVTGEAEYTFNMTLPNMLYGKLLRSPHPHAKIVSIDTSDGVKVDNAKVVKADIEADNGVIHVIDSVILPK